MVWAGLKNACFTVGDDVGHARELNKNPIFMGVIRVCLEFNCLQHTSELNLDLVLAINYRVLEEP